MNLNLKSLENLKVANMCVEHEYYNVAAGRFYYSIYLKMTHLLQEKHNFLLNEKQKRNSSHDFTLNEFLKKFFKTEFNNFTEQSKFKLNFIELKDFRIISDYKKESISKSDIIKIKIIYKNLEKMLNSFSDIESKEERCI